jgi:hypothetical protein
MVRDGSWLKNKYLILCFVVFIFCAMSCARTSEDTSGFITWFGAVPAAILQTGEHPLWFQLTEEGPVHIEAVEDAAFTSAFVPWPYALHIRFLTENTDGIVMAVNRDGFLKLTPNTGRSQGIAFYRFSGGDFWRQYTVGGFVFFDGYPLAVLYLDDRFITLDIPVPQPRAWSFNMNSNIPFPLNIPSLRFFPEEEGWNIDTLRFADDNLFYYRAARRNDPQQRPRMFRTADLSQTGEEISAEAFFNSASRRTVFSHTSLPPLPEGFVYTGIGRVGDSLFASWEEQMDFSIGAAGFVVIKP